MINELAANEEKWVKKVWICYWYIIGTHFAAQLFSYLFLPYPIEVIEFYVDVLLLPTIKMSLSVSIAWFISKVKKGYSFYTLFVAGTILAVLIIRLNTDIRIISALFLLPILASVIFFQIRLTLFSAALQLIAFFILLMLDESYRNYLSAFDVVAIPCFLGICTFLASIIMIRDRELQKALYDMMTAKQDLMVQYAIMRKQARIDALTNLYNQVSFYEHFELAMEYGRDRSSSFHLAIIDIDNFKLINDTYGHLAGDLVLARVAKIIKETVPSNDIAARYGGEEFAILLFETNFEEAVKLVETIRKTVSGTRHDEIGGNPVTISIGITSYEPSLSKENMFEKADINLYKAKRSGKNRTMA